MPTQEQNQVPQPTAEDSFRSSLEDVILIIEKLAPHAKDLDGMMGMLKLALTNDSQLGLIMHMVRPVRLKS